MHRQLMRASFVLAAMLAILLLALSTRPAAAASLALDLTPSATKVKVGDAVTFTATVTNTGTTTLTNVGVSLSLPDALNVQSIDCPGTTGGSLTECTLASLGPGETAVVTFIATAGTKSQILNGPISATASGGGEQTSDSLPALKIVGSNKSG
jgi:uncharacterized repeat protein (TIGR01451 family)